MVGNASNNTGNDGPQKEFGWFQAIILVLSVIGACVAFFAYVMGQILGYFPS
jgi:hypothetical protein